MDPVGVEQVHRMTSSRMTQEPMMKARASMPDIFRASIRSSIVGHPQRAVKYEICTVHCSCYCMCLYKAQDESQCSPSIIDSVQDSPHTIGNSHDVESPTHIFLSLSREIESGCEVCSA